MYLLTEELRTLEEEGFDITLSNGRRQRCVLVVAPVVLDWKEMRLSLGQFGSAQALFPHGHLHTPVADMGQGLLYSRFDPRTDIEHLGKLVESRKPGCALCVCFHSSYQEL